MAHPPNGARDTAPAPQHTTPHPRRQRGRPRSPEAEARALDAALEEYGIRGWSGFTMDGVARRACVGKSTLYLRWRDKDALLADAVAQRATRLAVPETGTLRGDLLALVTALFRHQLTPAGWATVRLALDAAAAGSAAHAASLESLREQVVRRQTEAALAVVRRGVERGELDASVPVATLVQMLHGTVTRQVLDLPSTQRLDAAQVEERSRALVDFVLAGLSPVEA